MTANSVANQHAALVRFWHDSVVRSLVANVCSAMLPGRAVVAAAGWKVRTMSTECDRPVRRRAVPR
jgi:hypothetical protein